MSDPTIDAIDHALDDWETSGDAMRWTMDPQVKPTPRLVIDIDPEPFLRAVRNAVRAITKAMAQFQLAAVKVSRLMAAAEEQETRMRRARMHAAYRQRQLARRRRNRRRR